MMFFDNQPIRKKSEFNNKISFSAQNSVLHLFADDERFVIILEELNAFSAVEGCVSLYSSMLRSDQVMLPKYYDDQIKIADSITGLEERFGYTLFKAETVLMKAQLNESRIKKMSTVEFDLPVNATRKEFLLLLIDNGLNNDLRNSFIQAAEKATERKSMCAIL